MPVVGHVGAAGERRGVRLQLPELPLGGAVDELGSARQLDVDLDPRLVHEREVGEAEERRRRLARSRHGGVVELLLHAPAQRLDERRLEALAATGQGLRDLGLVGPLARTVAALAALPQQLQAAGDDLAGDRRGEHELVVDELLQVRHGVGELSEPGGQEKGLPWQPFASLP